MKSKFQKQPLLLVKILLVLYLIFINILPNNKPILKFFNCNMNKLIFLVLIAVAIFYDITLAIILTALFIVNILLYSKYNLDKNYTFKDNVPKEDEINSKITDLEKKHSEKTRPYFLPPSDDAVYKSGLHYSLNELLPDTNKMTDMQSNIFDQKNLNKSVSPLKDQYDNQGIAPISGYEKN